MARTKRRIVVWLALLLFSGLAIFLTFNRHSKSGYFNYHSEIWADKAGYYVYLPATFRYVFQADRFPDSIDVHTGHGFRFENGKIISKYTYGVALMQAPFYLLAEALAPALGYDRDGFSPIYHRMINVAAVFYLILGLSLLYHFLVKRFRKTIALLVLASLFLGTNLYYYSIDETGMSHVYSFVLFCAFLYFLGRTSFLKKTRLTGLLLMGALAGLIVLIRPTNAIFLSSYLFLDQKAGSTALQRLQTLLKPANILPLSLGFILVFLPQFIYWKYAFGSYLVYAYDQEGFLWASPKILHTLFSPSNGLILYNPLYLIVIFSLIHGLITRKTNSTYLAFLFLAITYVFAAWWDWRFGCSFGARSYVEYSSILGLSLAHLFERVGRARMSWRILFGVLVLLLVAFNLKMTYSYDGCFYGIGDWDWRSYWELVTSPTK